MKKNMNHVKYYILSNLHKHAIGVIEETETEIIFEAMKLVNEFDPFTNQMKDYICIDENYTQVKTASKNDLSKVFEDVEITKDYWRVFEYFTGRKRKAIANASEF